MYSGTRQAGTGTTPGGNAIKRIQDNGQCAIDVEEMGSLCEGLCGPDPASYFRLPLTSAISASPCDPERSALAALLHPSNYPLPCTDMPLL